MVKISDKEKEIAFAILGVIAIAVGAYILFFAPPADRPSSIDGFYMAMANSSKAAIFLDARGLDAPSAQKVYQCGVDIVSGKLFGTKAVTTYACDNTGCLSANTAGNGTTTMTYEQVRHALPATPYAQISWGKPSTKFFERHMEITLDGTFNSTCRFG
ncbi:Uncharacterised protein [uncultured archaeon]|nr:Uncharacterised protein [uncultured archaeon]